MKNETLLTVREFAERLEVTTAHVRLLIRRGDLKAEDRGTLWLIPESEVERYRNEKKPVGRPKKG